MAFQFFKIIPLSEKENTWINDHGKIAKNYLTGWFFIDMVSVIPYDFIGLDFTRCATEPDLHSSGVNIGGQLKIIRTVRLMRLLKLVRMMRASRMMQQWESKLLAVNFKILALLKFAFIIILVGHWMACTWGLVGKFGEDPDTTWLWHNNLQDAAAHEM